MGGRPILRILNSPWRNGTLLVVYCTTTKYHTCNSCRQHKCIISLPYIHQKSMLAQLISALGSTKPKSRYQPSGLFLGGFGKNMLPSLLNWTLCSYRTEVLLLCWSQLGDCPSSLRRSALLVTLYAPSSNLSWHVKSLLFSKVFWLPFCHIFLPSQRKFCF